MCNVSPQHAQSYWPPCPHNMLDPLGHHVPTTCSISLATMSPQHARSTWPPCPHNMLDPLGHHTVTCKFGGDVASRHNQLRHTFVQTFCLAGVSASIQVGSGLGHEHLHTRPADVLLPNWVCSKPAALNPIVVSPLGSTHIVEAGTTAGSAALSAEERKHANDDQKCTELNWICVPMAVEVHGAWSEEAQRTFSRLTTSIL